ncbi:uncharacterized protein B0I36DRAFT_37812 [Microdochium trichocladiopsis]|uniref:Uncharacterized protein n=1 Tax=Microdochium trichocladiopsis TaxID=1682393 RepID=A0A9P8XXK5_9PEZI|nr:uncharacterized protein B0I36DRAFT_37812 [Microdochium trichocladiopsis]KAH7018313.1 hypothetical protein B0I36DRAFT_37812 [Microdochium trichocladiopsis]
MLGARHHHSNFSRSKWKKSILWPCWALQCALLLTLMGLFSYRVSDTLTASRQESKNQDHIPVVELVWESANIGFSLICLVITLLSVARFVAEALTPASMLFGNLVSLVFSAAILALDIVIHVQGTDHRYSLIGLVLDIVLGVSTLILSIYSIIVYRRVSKYDDYQLPYNVHNYGYDNRDDTSYMAHVTAAPTTQPYDPTDPGGGGGGGRVRSLSALSASSRRLSIGLRRESASSVQLQPVQDDASRRASYDHRRDTQFDEYRARRTSGASLTKEAVDHALGVEFGWSDAERKRDTVVSVGSVNAAAHSTNRPRGNSNPLVIQRHTSFEVTVESNSQIPSASTSGGSGSSTPQISRAHSLVCVPEHPEEDIGGAPGVSRHPSYTTSYSYQPSRMSEDREALLDPYPRPVSPMN